MWRHPDLDTVSIKSARLIPPSTLTICAPACINSRAESTASCVVADAIKGMSAIIRQCVEAAATLWVWYAISATVTGSVLLCPWRTMPSESPTKIASTPASDAMCVKQASYAVTTLNLVFSARCLFNVLRVICTTVYFLCIDSNQTRRIVAVSFELVTCWRDSVGD